MFFGKQKVARAVGRGLCYQDRYRGLSKAIAGAALACLAAMSGFANAAAVLTFYATEDGNVQAILTGSLDQGDDNGQTLNPAKPRIYSDGSLWLVEYGETNNLMPKYNISYSGSFGGAVSANLADTSEGDFFALWLGGPTFLALDSSYQTNAELNATLIWNNTDFGDLGLTVDESLTVTLDSGDTFTLRVSGDAPPNLAPVPLPASVLFLGAGIGGFGLMGRLRRRKLVS